MDLSRELDFESDSEFEDNYPYVRFCQELGIPLRCVVSAYKLENGQDHCPKWVKVTYTNTPTLLLRRRLSIREHGLHNPPRLSSVTYIEDSV